MDEKTLIQACIRQERKAQRMLYDQFAGKMFAVCLRYVKSREDAEDLLLEAFYKVFSNIERFKAEGSFEGWIRRIVVNECLMFLRKKHNFHMTLELNQVDEKVEASPVDNLVYEDIIKFLDQLPTGYRTIFNLYIIEGYKHREISEILNISINTSKSQLILAKKKLKGLLIKAQYPGVG
ncbi:MAG: sigma-70 family RNA polymerase sigma factor [Bacteroidota bacterium]